MAILSFVKNSKTNHKNCHKVAKMLKENVVIEHSQTMLVADENIGISGFLDSTCNMGHDGTQFLQVGISIAKL